MFNVFKDAVVDTIVCQIFKQKPSEKNLVSVYLYPRKKEISYDCIYALKPNIFTHYELTKNEYFIFNYRLNKTESSILEKIFSDSLALSNYARVTAGVKPYEVGKGKPPQTKKVVATKPYTKYEKIDDNWKPLIRGTQINPYLIKWDNEYILYGQCLAAPRTEEIFSNPKLFVRRTDDKILCAYDDTGMIGLNSVHCIQSINLETPELYLIALLNSKLMKWVFQVQNFHMINKPLAEIKVVFVERLPIKISPQKSLFIELATEILAAKKSNPNADTTALALDF